MTGNGARAEESDIADPKKIDQFTRALKALAFGSASAACCPPVTAATEGLISSQLRRPSNQSSDAEVLAAESFGGFEQFSTTVPAISYNGRTPTSTMKRGWTSLVNKQTRPPKALASGYHSTLNKPPIVEGVDSLNPGNNVSTQASLPNKAHSTSQYRGVTKHRHTGKWESHLWDNAAERAPANKSTSSNSKGPTRKRGKQVYLGGFLYEEDAARAYDRAALVYWGDTASTNFPASQYADELPALRSMTREAVVAALRRGSSGFSRGMSKYRGVTRHHNQGRWEARIGKVQGAKYLYLGTYDTEEEAAVAYDYAAMLNRSSQKAMTNFDSRRYLDDDGNLLPLEQVLLIVRGSVIIGDDWSASPRLGCVKGDNDDVQQAGVSVTSDVQQISLGLTTDSEPKRYGESTHSKTQSAGQRSVTDDTDPEGTGKLHQNLSFNFWSKGDGAGGMAIDGASASASCTTSKLKQVMEVRHRSRPRMPAFRRPLSLQKRIPALSTASPAARVSLTNRYKKIKMSGIYSTGSSSKEEWVDTEAEDENEDTSVEVLRRGTKFNQDMDQMRESILKDDYLNAYTVNIPPPASVTVTSESPPTSVQAMSDHMEYDSGHRVPIMLIRQQPTVHRPGRQVLNEGCGQGTGSVINHPGRTLSRLAQTTGPSNTSASDSLQPQPAPLQVADLPCLPPLRFINRRQPPPSAFLSPFAPCSMTPLYGTGTDSVIPSPMAGAWARSLLGNSSLLETLLNSPRYMLTSPTSLCASPQASLMSSGGLPGTRELLSLRRQLQLPGDSYLTELLRQLSSGTMSPSAKSSEEHSGQQQQTFHALIQGEGDAMALDRNAEGLALQPVSSMPYQCSQLQQHVNVEAATSGSGSPSIADSLFITSSFQMQSQLSLPEDLLELLGFTPRAAHAHVE
ncbi:hypothetical protein CEUSTIGMA_g1683.t1 [Chlamydomonas eustigma]|uniref:AP2/ERF domain-containing protein n=1 Tax=Chlamydomonas eustigma TaxID=1157962 RepID=A0A250WTU8_9CHLO|nr:hypothetical protein CEUSTIGMA_g1683.t1 [Chlamydomonas eustigma]|eukprot:GAX74234.1 hypothetical protein CEUSTIGMA_g1683.t1 [Chlamydomonas eustigma]